MMAQYDFKHLFRVMNFLCIRVLVESLILSAVLLP